MCAAIATSVFIFVSSYPVLQNVSVDTGLTVSIHRGYCRCSLNASLSRRSRCGAEVQPIVTLFFFLLTWELHLDRALQALGKGDR